MRVGLVTSLYLVSLENCEKQNFEIVVNTSEAGTWMKLLIFSLHLINNVTIKFIRAFGQVK